MKLRTKYIIFVILLHLVALVLSYFVFRENKILFIASEAFIIVSVIIAVNLYIQLIRPLKLLMNGVEAIKDQDFNVKFLPTGKYEVDQLIDVYNQMMDQLRNERTAQEQQHFFLEKLVHTSPAGIIILDFDDHIHQLNPKAEEILGLKEKEVLKQDISSFTDLLLKEIAQLPAGEAKTVKRGSASTFKIQKSHFVDRGFPRRFVIIQELTAEILEAEKNVYGKVIRMMAHEVNNTIGPVNSIIESTLKSNSLWSTDGDGGLKEALRIAVERNYNLNLFMRNFADLVKLPKPRRQIIDLNKLLQNVTHLMQIRATEHNVEIINKLPRDAFWINADEQLMEQALINIVKNAMEAIEGAGEVMIKVDPSRRELTIADNGKDISPEQSEQLFTPFFSTKKDGQGIGLTMVREILVSHGFEFSLKTIKSGYTIFAIKFN